MVVFEKGKIYVRNIEMMVCKNTISNYTLFQTNFGMDSNFHRKIKIMQAGSDISVSEPL